MEVIALREDGCQLIRKNTLWGFVYDPETKEKSQDMYISSIYTRGYWTAITPVVFKDTES
jgi:hypothetical protein